MYRLCLKRKFTARHFLFGGDWGDENYEHSHSYELELRLSGGSLDADNYLVDLLEVEGVLENVISLYRDTLLNSHPEFRDRNPSIEIFSRILAENISGKIKKSNVEALEVRLWENEDSWASWENNL